MFIQENAFENVVWKMATILFSLNELKNNIQNWSNAAELQRRLLKTQGGRFHVWIFFYFFAVWWGCWLGGAG